MTAPRPIFSPVRHTRASSDVVAQIRSAILSGQFRPGDRLPTERELVEQFGVGRTIVRDALRSLETSGLIQIKVGAQGGPYVAEPDISRLSESLGTHLLRGGTTFRELAEARLALETTAARLAAERATPEELESIRQAVEGTQRPSLAAERLDFHAAVVAAAHNHALAVIFTATRALIQDAYDALPEYQVQVGDRTERVHRDLYDALVERDGNRAVQIMREHLYDFAERAERLQVRLRADWEMPRHGSTGPSSD